MGNRSGKSHESAIWEYEPTGQENHVEMSLDTLSIVHKNMEKIKTRRLRIRNVENFLVIWLDAAINELNEDAQYSVHQLRNIANSIETFTDPDACIDFMADIVDEKIFLVVSGTLGRLLLPRIKRMRQMDSIYVFCRNIPQHKLWTTKYEKIKGVFDDIDDICTRLKQDVRQCERDAIRITIKAKPSAVDTNALDQSFMYSQLLKEVLLEFEYSDTAKTELLEFCRQQYAINERELGIIDEFEDTYDRTAPVWWYTRDCFVYSMLNKALRAQDIEVITRMGFFIRDLHEQIKQLHSQSTNTSPFTVYRGQGISTEEFETLRKSKGCLMSFNNFLSTSMLEDVSLRYARRSEMNTDTTALLFRMEVDPSVSSTPFAALNDISYFAHIEKEVLFSMHSVFRIGDIEHIEDRLWQVTLTLTGDNDSSLAQLTEHLRSEISSSTGLHRIGALMIRMGKFDKAEDIYSLLLEKTSAENSAELASLHHQLGYINDERGDLTAAHCHYDCSIRIELSYLPLNHPQLSNTYSKIGLILKKQAKFEEALASFEQALNLDLQASNPDQLQIARRQNSIGLVLNDLDRHADALKSYESALKISLTRLPPRHPDIARIYNNIGAVYDSMNDKLTALSYYKKTLEIEQRCLPSNHSTLAITHHHIATVLEDLRRYDVAIKHAKKAVDIARHTFDSHSVQMQKYESYLRQLLANR